MSEDQNAKPSLCGHCKERLDHWTYDRIRRLAAQITKGWELCDSWLQNSESELMICQTLSAAVINLEKRGEPYSIRGVGVFSCGQCVDNDRAYRRLVSEGYFTEEERTIDGIAATVIFMTPKLLDAVEAHFANEESKGP